MDARQTLFNSPLTYGSEEEVVLNLNYISIDCCICVIRHSFIQLSSLWCRHVPANPCVLPYRHDFLCFCGSWVFSQDVEGAERMFEFWSHPVVVCACVYSCPCLLFISSHKWQMTKCKCYCVNQLCQRTLPSKETPLYRLLTSHFPRVCLSNSYQYITTEVLFFCGCVFPCFWCNRCFSHSQENKWAKWLQKPCFTADLWPCQLQSSVLYADTVKTGDNVED